eukprot:comp21700_c0_seq1/m.48271 comp21700_c0_seq1/g.48271  ORF comp21700_c0_seq1/g.48271 comp21700_c0_seq1/m.48271 type:complete len:481 (-) comp21700_c0_seq1:75-1517(-)
MGDEGDDGFDESFFFEVPVREKFSPLKIVVAENEREMEIHTGREMMRMLGMDEDEIYSLVNRSETRGSSSGMPGIGDIFAAPRSPVSSRRTYVRSPTAAGTATGAAAKPASPVMKPCSPTPPTTAAASAASSSGAARKPASPVQGHRRTQSLEMKSVPQAAPNRPASPARPSSPKQQGAGPRAARAMSPRSNSFSGVSPSASSTQLQQQQQQPGSAAARVNRSGSMDGIASPQRTNAAAIITGSNNTPASPSLSTSASALPPPALPSGTASRSSGKLVPLPVLNLNTLSPSSSSNAAGASHNTLNSASSPSSANSNNNISSNNTSNPVLPPMRITRPPQRDGSLNTSSSDLHLLSPSNAISPGTSNPTSPSAGRSPVPPAAPRSPVPASAPASGTSSLNNSGSNWKQELEQLSQNELRAHMKALNMPDPAVNPVPPPPASSSGGRRKKNAHISFAPQPTTTDDHMIDALERFESGLFDFD